MRRLFLLALIAGAVAWAQSGRVGPNITLSFDIRELETRPGLIYLSPNYLTVLEFDDLITRVASARPELLSVDVRGNVAYLRALTRAGSTDLLVVAGGRDALFRVEIDPDATAPRRYVVRFPAPHPAAQAPRPAFSLAPATPQPTPAKPVAAVSAVKALPEGEGVPPYLSVKVVPVWDGHVLTLTLVLRNQGQHTVIIDPAAVRVYAVTKKGERRPMLIEVSGGGRVLPGGVGSLTVVAQNAPGLAEVVWRISEVGAARIWTYRTLVSREGK